MARPVLHDACLALTPAQSVAWLVHGVVLALAVATWVVL